MAWRLGKLALVLFIAITATVSRPAAAFILDPDAPDPWLTTASGLREGNGAPATITWSFVPNGTSVTRWSGVGTRSSNLITFLNTNFGGSVSQTDFTQQPWFHLFEESFGRWEELSGVDFVYEPEDSSVLLPSQNGSLGVRGDIRIGGYNVDGADGTLAFTYLPEFGSDMVIDTADGEFFSDSANNFRSFRNTLMHEIGHGFGLLHVESTSALLMEPFIDTSFDGPRLDEVRGVQYYFGDANEQSNGVQGNNTAALATELGSLAAGSLIRVGGEANVPGQAISPTALDFVSIANLDDVDFYQFTVSQPSALSATLTPRGGVFTQAEGGFTPTSFNANARNNLSLTLFDTDGTTVLASADDNPAGDAESLSQLILPTAGTFFARVAGANDTIQLYDLSLSLIALGSADYNGDGFVNAADYTVWRNSLGQTLTVGTGADGSGPLGIPDGHIDQFDFEFWKAHYGETAGSGTAFLAAPASVPEPSWIAGLIEVLIVACFRRWAKRRQAV